MVDIKRDRFQHGEKQDEEIKVHGDKLLYPMTAGHHRDQKQEDNLDRLSMLTHLHKGGSADSFKKHGDPLSPISPSQKTHQQQQQQHFSKPVYVADYDLDQDTSVCFLGLFDKEYDHQGTPSLTCKPKEVL